VNRINHAFGTNVALRTLFEQPTIRRLAVEIDALVGTAASEVSVGKSDDTIRALPRVPRKASNSGGSIS